VTFLLELGAAVLELELAAVVLELELAAVVPLELVTAAVELELAAAAVLELGVAATLYMCHTGMYVFVWGWNVYVLARTAELEDCPSSSSKSSKFSSGVEYSCVNNTKHQRTCVGCTNFFSIPFSLSLFNQFERVGGSSDWSSVSQSLPSSVPISCFLFAPF